MKRFLLCLATVYVCLFANAQDSLSDYIIARINERFAMLNDYISLMADKTSDWDTRQYYKKQALSLFAGRGYEYQKDDIRKEGALITIYSANKTHPRRMLVRLYFNRLANSLQHKVSIGTPHIQINDLIKEDTSRYVYTCSFDQIFIGYRDGIPIYKDINREKAKIYIEVEKTEDGDEYSILLGDIYAIDDKCPKQERLIK